MSPFRYARAVLTSTLLAGVCLAASGQQDAKPQDVKPPAQEAKPAAQEAKPPAQETKPAAQDPKAPAADSKQPQTRLRSGVELVSLNVTVMDGASTSPISTKRTSRSTKTARGSRSRSSRGRSSPSRSRFCSTPAPAWTSGSIAQEAAIGFAKRLRHEDDMEVIDFDSQVRILQTFTNDGAGARKGHPRRRRPTDRRRSTTRSTSR